jgi:hypothetical protein
MGAAMVFATAGGALAQSSEPKMERIDPPTLNVHPAYSQVTVVTGPHTGPAATAAEIRIGPASTAA